MNFPFAFSPNITVFCPAPFGIVPTIEKIVHFCPTCFCWAMLLLLGYFSFRQICLPTVHSGEIKLGSVAVVFIRAFLLHSAVSVGIACKRAKL